MRSRAFVKVVHYEGILEVVPDGGSEWASPIVAIRKPNGSIRVCADYKAGVNSKICNDYFPLLQVETAFSSMAGMSWFAKIHLSNAYFQIMLDKDSRNITTIATPAGLYR